jgi:EAL domain-containing protein (putative c-di-GMP-specific phosphodiesterase class I)
VVSVNVSARNLAAADFADRVLGILDASGVAADRLIVEITETALMADPTRAAAALRRLDEAGVRISLDDFGIGQTSLSQLSQLPLAEVKIDKTFVFDMLRDSAHASIVRAVIELAHSLGFVVVAEGVEDEATMGALETLDCDVAQGYLLARPMPATSIPGWLADHRQQQVSPVGQP